MLLQGSFESPVRVWSHVMPKVRHNTADPWFQIYIPEVTQ